MTQPHHPTPGERWNVNLPAVVGVVFVFLVGVVIWVITTSGSDGDDGSVAISTVSTTEPTADTTEPAVVTTIPATTPVTTSPQPMPSITPAPDTTEPTTTAPAITEPPTTEPPTTEPPITEPPTTAAGSDPGAVSGDLGIAGHPMQAPPCNGSFITVVASAVGDDVSAVGIEEQLDVYPSSNYLRTDQTCPSLRQNQGGQPIYVVFFGPFVDADDACQATADGPTDAYVRELSDDLGPNHSVGC